MSFFPFFSRDKRQNKNTHKKTRRQRPTNTQKKQTHKQRFTHNKYTLKQTRELAHTHTHTQLTRMMTGIVGYKINQEGECGLSRRILRLSHTHRIPRIIMGTNQPTANSPLWALSTVGFTLKCHFTHIRMAWGWNSVVNYAEDTRDYYV